VIVFMLFLLITTGLILIGLFLLFNSFGEIKLKETKNIGKEGNPLYLKKGERLQRAFGPNESFNSAGLAVNQRSVVAFGGFSKLFINIFYYFLGALILMGYVSSLLKVGKIALFPVYLGALIFLILTLITDWSRLLKLFVAAIFMIPANLYKLPVNLPFDLEIYRLIAFLMFGVWFLALLIDDKLKLRKAPLDFYLFLVSFSVFISLVINLNRFEITQEFPQAVKAFVYFLSFVVLYFFVVSTIRTEEEVKSVLKFIVGVGTFVSLMGIIERVTGFNLFRHLHEFIPVLQADVARLNSQLYRGGLRVAGSVSHPIAFGTMLALILPFSFYFWQREEKGAAKIYYLISSILIFFASLLTVSRTAFISVLLVLTCYFIAEPSLRKKILFWSLIGGFLVHMLFPGTLGRFRATLSPEYIKRTEIGNPAGRLEDYPRAYKEFSKFPVFGRGFGTFDPKKYFYLDNQYLGWLIELGLFGIFAHLLLFYSIVRFFWKAREKIPFIFPILVSSLVFITVCATFDTMGFSQIPYLFFLLIALGTSLIANADLNGFSEDKKRRSLRKYDYE